MTDPKLEPYWEAIREERYQKHLRHLHQQLDRKTARVAYTPRAIIWGPGVFILLLFTGFIPVTQTETTGFIIAGRTDSLPMSETMGALESLPFSGSHNLSVSADTQGTVFSLYVPREDTLSAELWMSQVESAVSPTELRLKPIDIITNQSLWITIIARTGITISASGTTREEIQAQVDQQLEALGVGRADVEQITGPDGQNTIRIIIRDLE